MYKILTNKEFTEEKDSPFKRMKPHKNFNTQWRTVYNRDLAELAEFTKEEVIEMCPKDVVDILVTRRDDGNRLRGPPIIELEFKKNTQDPHNYRRRKHSTRLKRDRPTLCEKCLQFGHSQKILEATKNSARTTQSICRKVE